MKSFPARMKMSQ